jgi:penicillin-binding protein 2
MNRYCTMLGLGEYTGIELPENKGILAGPEYKQSINKVWVPGDTLQAAIGQSDNSFNPLQLSSYISTIVNGGNRYKATVLYKVCNYSGSEEEVNGPQILNTAELNDMTIDAVKRGMRRSKELTSTTKFYNFPIGTKTGTAQTSKTNNNAVLVAFAPYDDPEIALSCVIENGASGVNAAAPVLKTISYYFGLDENGNPLPGQAEEN